MLFSVLPCSAIAIGPTFGVPQDAARTVHREEGTVPGAWPGLYACDYANLTKIMSLTADARWAVSSNDLPAAQVRRCSR